MAKAIHMEHYWSVVLISKVVLILNRLDGWAAVTDHLSFFAFNPAWVGVLQHTVEVYHV